MIQDEIAVKYSRYFIKDSIKKYKQNLVTSLSQYGDQHSMRQLELLQKVDTAFFDWLMSLRDSLNEDFIDSMQIARLINMFDEHVYKKSCCPYLETLLYPEKCTGIRLPSKNSFPSCPFHMKYSFNITTNTSGNFLFFMQPFYLSNTGTNTTAYLNSAATLTGNVIDTTAADYVPINVGQNIPAIYNQYRVVSGSITFIARNAELYKSGTISGGISMDNVIRVNTIGSTTPSIASGLTYSLFNNVDNCVKSQSNEIHEGLRMLYFPWDPTSDNYASPDFTTVSGQGFTWICYGMGLQASTNCIRCEINLNYEGIATTAYTDLIPSLPPTDDTSTILTNNKIVSDNCIGVSSDSKQQLKKLTDTVESPIITQFKKLSKNELIPNIKDLAL